MRKIICILISGLMMIGLIGCGSNSKVKDLEKRFTTEHGTGYGKELEDAWKQDKDNVELSAMYHYYNAEYYEGLGEVDAAKIEMRNINPNYTGVMSDEIVKYGIKMFESKEVWNMNSVEGEKSKKKLTDTQRQEIKKYIQQRYDYYDKKEGKYCGEKYTDTIFKEASQKYGFTVAETYNIWSNLDI